MPRTDGVYTPPAGTKGVPDTTIRSAPYNALVDDLTSDANNARPITAGGTGATNATDARQNLGALASEDLLAALPKATPVDADSAVITDSEDDGKVKRVTWANIKATLKTYFDTLYAAAGDYLKLSGGILTGTLVVATSLYIRSSGNRHVWFQNDTSVTLGLVYSDANTGDMHVRAYAADGVTYSSLSVRRDGRVTLPDVVSQPTDATSKRYVDAAIGTVSAAAAAAQSTANTANSAANTAQSTANSKITRDAATVAGFQSGNAALPYMRHEASNAVVPLARTADVAGLVTGVNAAVAGVGSYALCLWTGSLSSIGPGTNVPADQLQWSNANGSRPGGPSAGSWRLAGYISNANDAARTSLWVRYA